MKRLTSILAIFLALSCTVAPIDAYAKKFGGGKSFGRSYKTTQSQPQSLKSQPSQQQNLNQNQQASKSTAQQPQQKRGMFGGMMGGLLGGLLAGTLLGSLLGGAGFGGFGFIDFLLIAGLGFLAFKLFQRKRAQQPQTAGASIFGGGFGKGVFGKGDGFGADGFRSTDSASDSVKTEQPSQNASSSAFKGESKFGDGYRNSSTSTNTADASFGSTQGGFTESNDEVPFTLPPDFDQTGFVRRARDHYRLIQDAWNSGNMSTIREYVSPELYNHLVAERNSLQGDQHTEVMYVDAEIVRADYRFGKAEVSLRFNGRYRDNVERVEENITDIWHLEQSQTGAPWVITGIEYTAE